MYHCFTDVLLASTQFRKSQDYLEFFKIALISSFFTGSLLPRNSKEKSSIGVTRKNYSEKLCKICIETLALENFSE